ncbi:MAG: RNA polymerase sigma factor [Oscillospiraceae bacterium]
MTKEEELRLIKAAGRGDSAAFEQLVRDQQKLVYNLALKITGTPEDALDVSQEVFLKAYLNLQSFRGESRLSVWLYRLTYNACMDHIRKNRRQDTISLSPDDEGETREMPDPKPLPAEEAERHELQRQVWDAINMLPSDKREIIVMREITGMTYSEIGSALGIEEGTVKSRLSRSRLALADIIKKRGTFSGGPSSNGKKGGRRNG